VDLRGTLAIGDVSSSCGEKFVVPALICGRVGGGYITHQSGV
jgi:hypothetical protein